MSTSGIAAIGLARGGARRGSAIAMLLGLPAICWSAMAIGWEPAASVAILFCAGLVVRMAARDRFGVSATPICVFFAIAICHALVGYVMAVPTSIAIWIGTAAERVYATAFLVVSAGILAAALGYAFALPWQMTRLHSAIRRFTACDGRLFGFARIPALAGTALMFAVYATVGILPMLIGSFGRTRYLSAAGDKFALLDWLAARALDLLTFSTPLVLISAAWRRRKLDWCLGVVAVIAMFLPLRRANLLTVLFVILIMGALRAGRVGTRRIVLGLTLIAAYLASQLLFVSFDSLGSLNADRGVAIAAGALPEIRDLGWTIELIGNERLHGSTLLQSLLPVPSFVSDFSRNRSLRAETSHLIGLDLERQTGGLRLTLAGEGYLNFDVFGPVLLGFLFGIICAYVEISVRELCERRAVWAYFTAAFAFVWLCFWLYLGGTQSAATIKMGGAQLVAALWWSQHGSTGTLKAVSPSSSL